MSENPPLQISCTTRTLLFANKHGIPRSSDTLAERASILLHITDGHIHGYGESCPLPAFAGETFACSLHALEHIDADYLTNNLATDMDISQCIRPEYPCAQFALQCAVFDFLAQRQDRSIGQCIHPNATQTVQIQSLLTSASDEVAPESAFIKCKVGRLPHQDESQRLKQFHKKHPTTRLRLDANGAWTQDQAISFCNHVQDLPIDYLEDPCKDWLESLSCIQHTDIPIAIDQACQIPMHRDALLRSNASHLIIKPMCFGTVSDMQSFIQKCEEVNKQWVLSDFHNGNIARLFSWHIASALDPQAHQVHGLGGQHLFENDYCEIGDPRNIIPHSQTVMATYHD